MVTPVPLRHAPASPLAPAGINGMPFMHVLAEPALQRVVTRDGSFTWDIVTPGQPGAWQARPSELTGLLDMPQTDLGAFQRRGGKVLMRHGMADEVVPVQATQADVAQVTATMGSSASCNFQRDGELPGVAHSGLGTSFTPAWDVLGALDAWASGGSAPAALVATDTDAVPGRTRPLCAWPAYPRCTGGDMALAASFSCTAPG